MQIRIKVWLEENERVLFGEGRLQLLQAIEGAGSLAAAAKEMNMSYRAAWGRLHASEERLGFTLVERSEEGRRAMQLTPAAKELMVKFAKLEQTTQKHVDKEQAAFKKILDSARKQSKK